jgi:hypothetical protein
VFSYSSRFIRARWSVPRAASARVIGGTEGCGQSGENGFRLLTSIRSIAGGGISPSRTRSWIFTQVSNVLRYFVSNFSAVRSSPPFAVAAL